MLARGMKRNGKVAVAIFYLYEEKKKKLEHVHNWIEVKEELQVMKSRAQGEESALSRMRDIYSSEVQRSDIGVDSDGEEES